MNKSGLLFDSMIFKNNARFKNYTHAYILFIINAIVVSLKTKTAVLTVENEIVLDTKITFNQYNDNIINKKRKKNKFTQLYMYLSKYIFVFIYSPISTLTQGVHTHACVFVFCVKVCVCVCVCTCAC